MTHLTEAQLNEYFDKVLDPEELTKVEAHLSACRGCRESLQALSSLAVELAALPEQPLGRDLSAAVLARLPHRHAGRAGRFLMAVQGGLVLGLVLATIRRLPVLSWLDPGAVLERLAPTLPSVSYLIARFASLLHPPTFHLPIIALPAFELPASSPVLLLLAAAALVLGGVGNFLLLRARIEVRK